MVDIKEEVTLRDFEFDAVITMILGSFCSFFVCHLCIRIRSVRARRRTVGGYGNLCTFAVTGLIVSAEPYFLLPQLFHVHPGVTLTDLIVQLLRCEKFKANLQFAVVVNAIVDYNVIVI